MKTAMIPDWIQNHWDILAVAVALVVFTIVLVKSKTARGITTTAAIGTAIVGFLVLLVWSFPSPALPKGQFLLAVICAVLVPGVFFLDRWLHENVLYPERQAIHRMSMNQLEAEYFPDGAMDDFFLDMILVHYGSKLSIKSHKALNQVSPEERRRLEEKAEDVYNEGHWLQEVVNYVLRESDVGWVGSVQNPRRQIVQSRIFSRHNAQCEKWWLTKLVGSETFGQLVPYLLGLCSIGFFMMFLLTSAVAPIGNNSTYWVGSKRVTLEEARKINKVHAEAEENGEERTPVAVAHPRGWVLETTGTASVLFVLGLWLLALKVEVEYNKKLDSERNPGLYRRVWCGYFKIRPGYTGHTCWSGSTYDGFGTGGHFRLPFFTIYNDRDDAGKVKVTTVDLKDGGNVILRDEDRAVDEGRVLGVWEVPGVGIKVALMLGKLTGDFRNWERDENGKWVSSSMPCNSQFCLVLMEVVDPTVERIAFSDEVPEALADRARSSWQEVLNALSSFVPDSVHDDDISPKVKDLQDLRRRPALLEGEEDLPWPFDPQEHINVVGRFMVKEMSANRHLERSMGLCFSADYPLALGDVYYGKDAEKARERMFVAARNRVAMGIETEAAANTVDKMGKAQANALTAMNEAVNNLVTSMTRPGSDNKWVPLGVAGVVLASEASSKGSVTGIQNLVSRLSSGGEGKKDKGTTK